jgi:lysozyme
MAKNPMQAVRKKPTRAPKRKSTKKKKSSWTWISLLIVILASGAVGYFFFKEKKVMTLASFRKNVPEGFQSIGLDVSHHQGKINWEKLMIKNGYDSLIHFVYCKATEGHTHFDTKWKHNRESLNNLGIPNGAYHFFSTKEAPLPQVNHFLSVWKKRDIDLPPVLDVETEGISDADLIQKMTIWLEEVEKRTGFRPIIYTSLNFYETKFKNHFSTYRFWIAAYSRKPSCIEDSRIIHWQYTETGRLPGIHENVDLNVSKLKF